MPRTHTDDSDVYAVHMLSLERLPPMAMTLELSGGTAKPRPYAPKPSTVSTRLQVVQSDGDAAQMSFS